jgi:hypothetical protein
MDNCRRSYDFFLLANLVVKIHIFHGNIKISSIQNLIYIDSIFIALVWLDLGISFLSKYRVVPKPAYIDAVFDPNWNVSCRYNTFYAMCVCVLLSFLCFMHTANLYMNLQMNVGNC